MQLIFKNADETASAADAQVVAPNDGADLPDGPCIALYVGVGGNIRIITAMNTDVTFVGVGSSGLLPVRAKKVFATGTTATNIIALY